MDVVRSKLDSLNELASKFFAQDNDFLAGNYDVNVDLRRLLSQLEGARETFHHLGSLRDPLLEQKRLRVTLHTPFPDFFLSYFFPVWYSL